MKQEIDCESKRVLIIEDHQMVSDILVEALSEMTVDTAVSIAEARNLAQVHGPYDATLLDLYLPKLIACSEVEEICEARVFGAVVVLSGVYVTALGGEHYKELLSGYLPKGISLKRFQSALSYVMAGGKIFADPSEWPSVAGPEGAARLSPLERVIVKEIACGATNKKISEKLNVPVGRVAMHVRSIFKKLECDSRAALAVIAFNSGLL